MRMGITASDGTREVGLQHPRGAGGRNVRIGLDPRRTGLDPRRTEMLLKQDEGANKHRDPAQMPEDGGGEGGEHVFAQGSGACGRKRLHEVSRGGRRVPCTRSCRMPAREAHRLERSRRPSVAGMRPASVIGVPFRVDCSETGY